MTSPDASDADRVAPRFCPADGCGLTVEPGAARWIHKPAGPEDTKEGRLR